MEGQGSLLRSWLDRLDGGVFNLEDEEDLGRFPELVEAVAPAGFELAIDEGYVADTGDDQVQVVLRGRTIPPGIPTSARPPQSGAVGIEIGTADGYCEIETLDLPGYAQARGLGRLSMASIAELGDRLGLEALTLEAGKTGRYAWARCGFNFMHPDTDRPKVIEAATEFADALGVACSLGEIEQPWELAALPGRVSWAEVERAGGPQAPPGREDARWNLGRALLLGPAESANTWFGRLDPRRESPDRIRLDSYARAA